MNTGTFFYRILLLVEVPAFAKTTEGQVFLEEIKKRGDWPPFLLCDKLVGTKNYFLSGSE